MAGEQWFISSDYPQAVLDLGPSLYWRLNETSGTTAKDISGYGRDGTYVGTPTLGAAGAITGDFDKAVDFDAIDDTVSSTYAPFANGATRTFNCWAWRDTSSATNMLFGGGSGTPPYLGFGATQGALWQPANSAFASWAAVWPGNSQWVHCALIVDEPRDTAELFINGVSQTAKASTDAYSSPGNLQVGAYWGNLNYWDGKIDEFAVFERALTATQISNLYTAGST